MSKINLTISFAIQSKKKKGKSIQQNLDTSSSMKTRIGFTSEGVHFMNSLRQLCSTFTGVTISAVLKPRSTPLMAVYRKAMTCNANR
jgi:hypothetical protein